MEINEIKRQLVNVRNQQIRLRLQMKDPEAYKKKRSEVNKKYWASLPSEKKKELLEKHSMKNKQNPERCKIYRKRYYEKHKAEILEKLRIKYKMRNE